VEKSEWKKIGKVAHDLGTTQDEWWLCHLIQSSR